MIKIQQLAVLNDNYIYLIHDTESGDTAVVDPALAEPVLNALKNNHWQLKYILNTHHHNDHVGGNIAIKTATDCKVVGSSADHARIPAIDLKLQENDTLSLGEYSIKVIECSGHTLGHIAFYIPEVQALFCGDTLFSMGCGRLFEGSAEQMWQSLKKFMQLPLDTQIYCAHEYSLANAQFALSVEPNNQDLIKTIQRITQLRTDNIPTIPVSLEAELATNPFLRPDSIDIRSTLNMNNASNLEVFTELRKRKNNF